MRKLSVLLALVIFFTACTAPGSQYQFTGAWFASPLGIDITYVILDDGTITSTSAFGNGSGTWSLNGSALHISWNTGSTTDATVSWIDSNHMTWTPTSGGMAVTLTRQ